MGMICLHAHGLRKRGIDAAACNPGAVSSSIWWYLRGFKKVVFDLIMSLVFLTVPRGAQSLIQAATCKDLPPCPAYFTPYRQIGFCGTRLKSWCDTIGPFSGVVHTG